MGSAAEQISCRHHRRRRTSLAEATTEEWRKLCGMLFPSSIMKHILKPEVKHIYIGSDLPHHLPFVLLPGPVVSPPLFKNCTLSHVNSSSELLQKAISVRLNALEEQQQPKQTPTLSGMQHGQVEPSKQNEPQSSTLQQSVAQVPKYMCETILSDHTECYIFADPNYDLHTSNSSSRCGRHLQTYGSPQLKNSLTHCQKPKK